MYNFKDHNGNILLTISQSENHSMSHTFHSRNEINALINEAILARDSLFPKSFVPPLVWSTCDHITEISTNRKFCIKHLSKNEQGENEYSLFQLEQTFNPKTQEHFIEQQLIRTSTKVLNLKEIANLVNQDLHSISEKVNNEKD